MKVAFILCFLMLLPTQEALPNGCLNDQYGNETFDCGYENQCRCSSLCMDCANRHLTTKFIDNLVMPDSISILLLENNSITNLDGSLFQGCENLQVLSLQNNSIKTIAEDTFADMLKLKFLHLGMNQITSVPKNLITKNTELVDFVLRGNSVSTIDPTFFKTTTKLEFVDMSYNKLQAIPSFYSEELGTAFFFANRLTNVPIVEAGVNDIINISAQFIPGVQLALNNTPDVPFIGVGNNPVTCAFLTSDFSGFACHCSEAFEPDKRGNCQRPQQENRLGLIVGSSVAGAFVGFIIAVGLYALRQNFMTLRWQLGNSEKLLEEQENLVSEMQQAWRIEAEDVKLLRRIDTDVEGAYGEVWYATWDGIGVALKKLRESVFEFDEKAREDFAKEVDFLRRCRHGNIVRFFGTGKMDSAPFLVTEYLANGSLKHYLRENKSITWKRRLSFAVDIQQGMHYIHTLKRMHRDLKTANVLLSPTMKAKIGDFGTINDMFRVSYTTIRPGSVTSNKGLTMGVGTPLYMAPEVLQGTYGFPADTWSYGIVLWEIATGDEPDLAEYMDKKLFKGPYLMCLRNALNQGNRLPLEIVCPSGYKDLVTACTQQSQMIRPTFDEVGEILEKILIDMEGTDLNRDSLLSNNSNRVSSASGGGDSSSNRDAVIPE
eukprot:m.79748 g.79748  ORF g.79748 m.79748 type:complete len:659 (+) comp12727_c0_seq1:213-2189(+)